MRDAHRQARTEIPIVSARSDSEQKDGARRMAFRMPDYDRRVLHTHTNLGDILANAITHGIGAALAIAGAVYLIVASTRGSSRLIVSCVVFSGSLVMVYLCSTLYHSLVRTRARSVLSYTRSLFHLLAHRWHVHAVHAHFSARRHGMDSLRHRVGAGCGRRGGEKRGHGSFHGRFPRCCLHGHLLDSGLAGDFCGAIAASMPSAGTQRSGWLPAALRTRWALCFSRSTGSATFTLRGTSSCSPEASPTTARSCFTWSRRARNRSRQTAPRAL